MGVSSYDFIYIVGNLFLFGLTYFIDIGGEIYIDEYRFVWPTGLRERNAGETAVRKI